MLRSWGWSLRIVGLLLVLGGYLFSRNVLLWLRGDPDLVDGRRDNEAALNAFTDTNAMTSLLIGVGVLLLYVGYRRSLGLAKAVLEEDVRAPVLYLRSFHDDGQHSLTPRLRGTALLGLRPFVDLEDLGPLTNLHPVRVLRLAVGRAMDTAEEQLAAFFRRVGPFVAIGQPGEPLVTGGAARVYVDDEHWMEAVLGLMRRASLIVLQPADGDGVWREIHAARALAAPRRVLLSLANFQESEQRYEEFRLRFERFIGHALPRNVRSVLFLRFDAEWRPSPVRAVFYSPFLWPLVGTAVNLKRTLRSFLQRIHAGTVTAAAHRFRLPRASSTILAAILWPLVVMGAAGLVSAYSSTVAAEYQLLGLLNRSPQQTFTAKSGLYSWHLGRGWHAQPERSAKNADFYTDAHGYALAVAVCLPGYPPFGNPRPGIDGMLDAIREQGRTVVSEEHRTVRSTGRDWLQVTALVRDQKGESVETLRSYNGPDVRCVLRSSLNVTGLHLDTLARQTAVRILDGFELPPLNPTQRELATATLQDATDHPRATIYRFEPTGMTAHLGKGWTVVPLNKYVRCYRFLGSHDTELFLFRSDAMPDLPSAKALLEALVRQLEETETPVRLVKGKDVEASNPAETFLSGDTVQNNKRARVGSAACGRGRTVSSGPSRPSAIWKRRPRPPRPTCSASPVGTSKYHPKWPRRAGQRRWAPII